MGPQALLDPDVLAGGIPQVVIAVDDPQDGMLRPELFQPLSGAVDAAVIHHYYFRGVLLAVAKHAPDTPLNVVPVAVGVEDIGEIVLRRAL